MRFLFLPLLAALLTLTTAQSSTTSSTPSSTQVITPQNSVNATIYPGDSTYKYYGCYNETTLINNTAHLRALSGGATDDSDTMTVDYCLKFCTANGEDTFAGLEYTRECYCATTLSSLSAKLPDSSCNLACIGNTSEFCGGSLTLSVYQKASSKGNGAASEKAPVVGSILALGVAVGVLVGWS